MSVSSYVRANVKNQLEHCLPIGDNIDSLKTKTSFFGNEFNKDDKILYVAVHYPEDRGGRVRMITISDKELDLFDNGKFEVINGKLYFVILETFSEYIENIGRD